MVIENIVISGKSDANTILFEHNLLQLLHSVFVVNFLRLYAYIYKDFDLLQFPIPPQMCN